MKLPFFPLAFSVAGLLALAAAPAVAAPAPAVLPNLAIAAPTDTVVLRLPNQVLMTLVVRDAAQLRELKKYQLDSLTSRLASYIDKTEAAARAGSADRVTLRFQPDQDHPGQQLPAEVRITARKPTAGQAKGNTRTEATMEKKKYGFSTSDDGLISYRFRKHSSPDDSLRRWKHRGTAHFGVRFDLGPNVFVNSPSGSAGVPSLRQWDGLFGGGVGYYSVGFNIVQPLIRQGQARLAVTFGPEITNHNFVLTGSEEWVYANGAVSSQNAPLGRNLERSRLSLTSLELPVMLRFRLLRKSDHDVKTLSAGVGAFGGYRLGSSIETEYKLGNSDLKHEDEIKGQLGLRNWQYGVQGEIGFHALRLFARYNLNELFETGKGPQTHAMAVGLRILGY